MEMKVGMMIKLLEEDGDSFARKAEMYFKKRPELLKLVEEFYRAYRALADRYDHATVALKQAHRTIQEAFPNQIPSTPSDSSTSSDQLKEAFDEETTPTSVSISSNGKARKGLNFLEEDLKGFNGADSTFSKEGSRDLEEESLDLECQKLSDENFEEKINTLTKQLEEREQETEALKNLLKEAELRSQSLSVEFDRVKGQNEDLSKELRVEKSLKVKAEETLESSEREIKIMFLDLQNKTESANDLGSKVEKLEEENERLNAQILSFSSIIKSLQDEKSTLEETVVRLEREAEERENEKTALQDEVKIYQDEISELDMKWKSVIDQIEGVGLSEELFEVSVREIQREKQELKERCEKMEDEKILALDNLEVANEKCSLLEKEIMEINGELEGLKTKMSSLEESCDSLKRRNEELITENGNLSDTMENSLKDANGMIVELKETILSLTRTHEVEKAEILESRQREVDKIVLLESSLSKMVTGLERERETVTSLKEKIDNQIQTHENEKAALLERERETVTSLKEKIDNLIQTHEDEKAALLERERETVTSLKEKIDNLIQNHEDEKAALLERERETVTSLKEKIDNLIQTHEDEKAALLERERETVTSLKEKIDNLIQTHADEKAALVERRDREAELGLLLENSLSNVTAQLEKEREMAKSLKEKIQNLTQIHEEEKAAFLKSREIEAEKALLLENSLSNTTAQLEKERETAKSLKEKIQNLIQTHEVEKVALLESRERETERGLLLENSLSKATAELDREKETSRLLEASCASLNVKVQELLSENGSLSQHLTKADEDIQIMREKLQSKNLELEGLRVSSIDKEASLIGQLEKAAEMRTYLEKSLSESLSDLESLKLKEISLQETCDSLNKKMDEINSSNGNLEISLKDAVEMVDELRDTKAALLGQLEEEREKNIFLEKSLSETKSKFSIEIQELGQQLTSMAENNALLEKSLLHANGEIEGMREKMQLMGEKESVLENSLSRSTSEVEDLRLKEKSLEESCDLLNRKIADVTSENSDLLKNNETLRGSLSDALGDVEALGEKVKGMEESLKSMREENSNLLYEKISLSSELEQSSSYLKKAAEKFMGLQEKHLKLERERESNLFLMSELKSSLSLTQEELKRLTEEHLELQTRSFVFESQLVRAEESFSAMERENLEQKNLVRSVLEHSKNLQDGLQSVMEALGIENSSKYDYSIFQSIIFEFKEIKRVLSNVMDENFSLILGETVKSTLMTEMGRDFTHLKLANIEMAENLSTLMREKEELSLDLVHFKSENSGKAEQMLVLEREKDGLGLDLMNLKSENMEMAEKLLTLMREKEELGFELMHLKSESSEKAKEMLTLKREKEELGLDVMHWKSLSSEMTEKLLTLKREKEELGLDIMHFKSESREKTEQMSTLKREKDELDLDVMHLKSEIGEMAEKLLTVMREKEVLGLDLTHSRSENSELSEEMLTLKREKDEMGLDLTHSKSENIQMAEQLLTLMREKDNLGLDLMQLKSENSEMAERLLTLKREKNELGLNLAHLKSENGEMAEQLLAVKREKEERENQLIEELGLMENVLLDHRDKMKTLEEENLSSMIEAMSQNFLSLLFQEIASERGRKLTDLAQRFALLETQNDVLENLVDSLNIQIETGRNLLSHKDLEFEEAHQRFKISEDIIRAELNDSDLKILKLMDEVESYEEEAFKLLTDSQFSEICSQIFEERVYELMEQCAELEERVVLAQKSSDSLERELTAYLPLVLSLQESVRCLEKEIISLMEHHGMKIESKEETSSTHPSEKNLSITDLGGFLVLQMLHHEIESLRELIRSSISSLPENKNKDKAPGFPNSVVRQTLEPGQGSTDSNVQSIIDPAEDQMLRLWETDEGDTRHSSSELVREKVDVDHTGLPGKVNHKRDWSRRMSDRLSSDAQRLFTLQNNIEELKTQLERELTSVDKSTELKYSAMIGRLNRVNEAVNELVNANADSMRRAEALTGGGVDQKRQVAEEVQSWSERIGKLEMEMRKVRYVLLKTNEEREAKARGGVKRSRTVLRDYFYGTKRPVEKRWWVCASCIRSNVVST